MNKNTKTAWLLLLCAIGIVIYTFSDIVLQPGSVMLSTGGDGAKNYFTYLFHIQNGQGLWFRGMNYPFGEHLVFADAQPLLSVPLAALQVKDPAQALGLMHLLLAAGFVLGILYTYKTLLHFRVAHWLAAIAAVLIVLCCPQVARLSGHFALAYACFVPMLFYFTLRYGQGQQWRYALYLFLLGFILYFLHPYYIALLLMWSAFYMFSYCVVVRQPFREKLRHILPMAVALVLVLGACRLFMFCTDPVHDRPAFPHGAMAYGTDGLDIFTSGYSAFWQLLKEKQVVDKVGDGREGMTYPGLAVLAIVATTLVIMLLQVLRKKTRVPAMEPLPFRGIWLLMLLLTLLLGMGVPFVWEMDWLLQYLSLFKQFRTLGRFIWLFYQLLTVFAVASLYHYFRFLQQKGRHTTAWIILLLPLAFWAYETTGYTASVRRLAREGLENRKNYTAAPGQNWQAFLQQQNLSSGDFQALLLLPYVHIGSEKWSVRGFTTGIMYEGFKAALDLKLPIADVMMSRTSWSQTAGQVRIAAGPYADKPLMRNGNEQPFLVLKSESDSISTDEWTLLRSARYLGSFGHCGVYACYPAKVRHDDSLDIAHARAIAATMQAGDTVAGGSPGIFYVDHMDQHPQPATLYGKGAIGMIQANDTLLAAIAVPPGNEGQLYELSTWVLLGDKDFRAPVLNLSLTDAAGNELFRQDARVMESFDNHGLWFRTCIWFRIPEHCSTISWRLYNDDKRGYIALDELLLKPADALYIYRQKGGPVLVNNHLLPH